MLCLCYIYLLKTIYIYTTAQVTIPLIWKKREKFAMNTKRYLHNVFLFILKVLRTSKIYIYLFNVGCVYVYLCFLCTKYWTNLWLKGKYKFVIYISQFTDTHIYGKFDLWKDSGRNVSYSLGLTKIYLPLLCFLVHSFFFSPILSPTRIKSDAGK